MKLKFTFLIITLLTYVTSNAQLTPKFEQEISRVAQLQDKVNTHPYRVISKTIEATCQLSNPNFVASCVNLLNADADIFPTMAMDIVINKSLFYLYEEELDSYYLPTLEKYKSIYQYEQEEMCKLLTADSNNLSDDVYKSLTDLTQLMSRKPSMEKLYLESDLFQKRKHIQYLFALHYSLTKGCIPVVHTVAQQLTADAQEAYSYDMNLQKSSLQELIISTLDKKKPSVLQSKFFKEELYLNFKEGMEQEILASIPEDLHELLEIIPNDDKTEFIIGTGSSKEEFIVFGLFRFQLRASGFHMVISDYEYDLDNGSMLTNYAAQIQKHFNK